ncbi:MAG TPA: hypothetical protein DDZ96_11890 [Porphyromonadaceae bacterium]|nr:hypothetical protein [Porphyromonadaceae bacterium]HBX45586.1 hypothetical protein [Porphyromonadaceae bacterium]
MGIPIIIIKYLINIFEISSFSGIWNPLKSLTKGGHESILHLQKTNLFESENKSKQILILFSTHRPLQVKHLLEYKNSKKRDSASILLE